MPGNQSVAAVPALVYSPSLAGTPHVTVNNLGRYPVYLGQAGVTAASGFPLYPNNMIDLPVCPVSLYAVGGYTKTATATTTTADAAAGATTLAITSGAGTANGGYVLVGVGAALEVVSITSGGGTTTLTTSALAYDHVAGEAVTVVTNIGGQINVLAGTS